MSQGLENVLIHLILASPIGEAARQSFHLSDRRDVKLIKLIYSIKGEKPPSRPIAIEVYENYTNNRLEYLRRFFEEKQITVRDFLQHQEKCGNFNGYFLQFLEINQKIIKQEWEDYQERQKIPHPPSMTTEQQLEFLTKMVMQQSQQIQLLTQQVQDLTRKS